jgi:hypothetical protein
VLILNKEKRAGIAEEMVISGDREKLKRRNKVSGWAGAASGI